MTELLKTFDEHVRGFAQSSLSDRELLANFAMGLAGEAGEVTDLLKKYLCHGDPIDHTKVIKEAGDVFWYWFALMQRLEYDRGLDFQSFFSPANVRTGEVEDRLFVDSVLRFNGAAGMAAEQIANGLFSDSGADNRILTLSMRETLRCLALILAKLDIPVETVLNANIEKLRARHGGTSFDREAQRLSKAAEVEA